MNKSELVNNVFDKTLIMHNVVQKVYDAIFDEITLALQAGDVVTLPKFGTFKVTNHAERPGTNPRTGKKIIIPARKHVGFSAYTKLRAAVNGGNNHGDN